MVRKVVIAVLPAALAVSHAAPASAWVIMNGGGDNGTHINGIHINRGGDNGQGTQGVSPSGGVGAMVISIELPAPVAC